MRNKKIQQDGRSMVEMLGVMAIIGVLSVVGLQGYAIAMKKHKANEILNETMQRAVGIAMKLSSGKELPTDENSASDLLDDMSQQNMFRVRQNLLNPEQFEIHVMGVSSEVCNQFEGSESKIVRKITCFDEKAVFTFNKDLSEQVYASDFNGNRDGCIANKDYVYCPDGTCALGECLKKSNCEPSLDCGENGTLNSTDCRCECNEGWFGKACEFDCVLDSNNNCHTCSEIDRFKTTEEECAKCDNEEHKRKIITLAKNTYCAIADCGSEYFQNNSGVCYSCSDLTARSAVSEENCLKCQDYGIQREMQGTYCVLKDCGSGYFHNETGSCVSCSEISSKSLKGMCSECNSSSELFFKSTTGYCYSCSEEVGWYFSPSTTLEECNVCSSTKYPHSFGLDGRCYNCSVSMYFPATSEQCSKCNATSTPRKIFDFDDRQYSATQCGLVTCPDDHFQDIAGGCNYCTVYGGINTKKEACLKCANSEDKRFYRPYSNVDYGACYSCWDYSASPETKEECQQCSGQWDGTSCKLL